MYSKARDGWPRKFGRLPTGRQAACRAFSSGLTRIASHAGCSAAKSATATPLPSASASSRSVKLPETQIDRRENKLPTVSPTATSAARARSQPSTAPTNRANQR